MAASSFDDGDKDMEKGGMILQSSETQNHMTDPSPTPSPSATATAPALVLSNSGKRMDQSGKKKYVKQVTGRHNDTELHLAAQRGDLAIVQQILKDINSQMEGTLSGEEFDAEVAKIRASIVNEVNELGETALFTAADKESIAKKNRSGYDPLHIAAIQGHHDIVEVLLDHDSTLSLTFVPSNATPLVSAAMRGHTEVVNQLLSKAGNLLDISRSNHKNALHLAARQGHVDVIKALLDKDPQLARWSSEVVKLLLDADPAIVMLPDKSCNTALHVATRKKRPKIVELLLSLPNTNANALTRERKTTLYIAEGLPLSEESSYIKECLARCGALRANELNQQRDELRSTVTQIKNDVHIQLEQTKRTNKNVHNISKELRKLHREGINNATNSVTVVVVLFATVAFAAIFTVPGGDNNDGSAVVVGRASFKIFFIFNAITLFTSLAVVVVQITLVRGETKAEKRVVEVINKLMWLASMCTSVAFLALSYIVVGRKNKWVAELVTVVGGVIIAGVLGTMTYYVVKSERLRSMRKRIKSARRSGSNSWHHSDYLNSEVDPIFAI
ncbi:hypothetical protein N665_4669s0001 [Sinapis alba]|nr:hypothetical protein N665_4669s0001 [Sinapis alba]